MSGFRREELSTIADWFNAADIRTERPIQSILENIYRINSRFHEGEIEITTRSGEKRVWDFSSVPIGRLPDGRRSIMSTAVDVTDRKQAEEKRLALESQLRQAQKMDSLGTLAGGIAHDFNNILFPIIGFAEMILMETNENHPFYDPINRILKAAKRGSSLTRQILAFSRQQDQEIKPVKIQGIIHEAMKLIRPTLPTTIQVTHHIDEECGLVLANATQLHQVIMNLTTNAYHAMQHTGGNLDISLEEARLEENNLKFPMAAPGTYVCLTVSDTGMGMNKSTIDRIFDPYFTTKGKNQGTGLGLATVHSIIDAYNGHIRVDSKTGMGTTFKVVLPMLENVTPEKPAGFLSELKTGKENILVVDDEENIAELMDKILSRLGYRVTACIGSRDALDKFKQNPQSFDLIITDLTMPHMTGVQLAREAFALRNDIPVILSTGFSDSSNENSSEYIKAFLDKPIDVIRLSNIVRDVLDGHMETDVLKKESNDPEKVFN